MPSTYTTNGGIEKIASGEQSGTWGATTNDNFDIIDRLTNGVGTITLPDSDTTITTSDGSLSDGQYKVLILNGSLTANRTITIEPADAQKLYFFVNNTGRTLIFTQGSGSNATLTNGNSDIIYCDGAGATAAVASLTTNIFGYVKTANNLSDLASAATALTNLGINATANELNVLQGIQSSTTELNYNDITTLGTSQASKVVTADANGDVKFSNAIVETVYNATATLALNPNNGTMQYKTITQNSEFTDSLSEGESMILQLEGGLTYTVTWPATGVTWVSRTGNNSPNLTGKDTIAFFKIDAVLYGVWVGGYV